MLVHPHAGNFIPPPVRLAHLLHPAMVLLGAMPIHCTYIYSIYTMREPSRSPKLQAGRQWILPYVLLLIWRSVKIMIFHYLFIRLALFPPRIWRSHHAGATPAALASDSEAGGLQDGHLGLPFVVRHGSGLPGR